MSFTDQEVEEVMQATGMDLQDALTYLDVKSGGSGDVVEIPEAGKSAIISTFSPEVQRIFGRE